jgi:hypothetical protein
VTSSISAASGSAFGCEESRREDQWYSGCCVHIVLLVIEGSLAEMCFEVLNRNRLPERLF